MKRLILTILFVFLLVSPAWATTYYVDTASDGGDGTTESLTGAQAAFKTIAAAQAAITGNQSDNSLLFKRGCTWREQFTVGANGTSGHPFTIGAYGTGDNPIISGADLVGTWEKSNIVELITNGDVEAGTPTLNSLDFSNYTSTDAQDAGQAHAGLNSLKVTCTGSHYFGIKWSDGSDHGLVSGTTYYADVWVYLPSGQDINVIRLYVGSNILDSTTTTDEWVNLTGNWVDNDTATFFDLRAVDTDLGDATGDFFYVDDFSLIGPSSVVYEATLAQAPDLVWMDGTVGIKESGSCPDDLNVDTEWCHSGTTLYQYSTSDPDIRYTASGTEASQRDYCIYNSGSADYITIDGLSLKNSEAGAITSDDNGNWIIKNSTFDENYRHIFFGDLNGNTFVSDLSIFSNTFQTTHALQEGHFDFSSVKTDYTNNVLVHNNTFDTDNRDQALYLKRGSGNKIYENEITDCSNGIAVVLTTSAEIYRNYIHDLTGYGIATQYSASGTKIYYNIIYNSTGASGHGDYNGIDINTNSDDGKCYNNTVVKVPYACLSVEDTDGGSDGWEIKNNILDASDNNPSDVPIIVDAGVASITLSNNVYWDSGGGTVGQWMGSNKTSYATWLSAVNGQGAGYSEANSMAANPLFRNAAAADFRLKPRSPCIGAGVDVGLTTDFLGKPITGTPSIGAYQWRAGTGCNCRGRDRNSRCCR